MFSPLLPQTAHARRESNARSADHSDSEVSPEPPPSQLVYLRRVGRREEKRLSGLFGEEYDHYCQGVRRGR